MGIIRVAAWRREMRVVGKRVRNGVAGREREGEGDDGRRDTAEK